MNEHGRDQAQQLAGRLSREGAQFDALYSSDCARASETAAILGEALGMSPVLLPLLRETDAGDFKGKLYPELAVTHADFFQQRANDPEHLPYPNGESIADVRRRANEFLVHIRENHVEERVLAVTHGEFLRVLLEEILSARGLLHKAAVGNTAICKFELSETKRLISWNDTSHLEPRT